MRPDSALRARFTPTSDAVLYECATCGLEYFSPYNQGDASFYELLSRHAYYQDRRWEFDRAEKLLEPGGSVIDIGCGDGGFLKQVESIAGRAVGVDQNPEGMRQLRAAGIEGHCLDLAALAQSPVGQFDLVCGFQVVEHLSDLEPFVQAVQATVAPGGRLMVSVPNAERLRINPLDPLDCPPHHVSHWRPAQLRELALRAGFEVTSMSYERPTLRSVTAVLPAIRKRLRFSRERSETPSPVDGIASPGAQPKPKGRLRALLRGHTMAIVARRPS